MHTALEKIKDESASAMVENVIVMPLVFIVIFFMILGAFMVHDRTTVEAAAQRGAIYAAHCISDPNYAAIVGQSGELDVAQDRGADSFSFSGVGGNIKPYRYIFGGGSVSGVVESETRQIVNKTRIPWRPQESIRVTCKQKNMFLYQDVTVEVTSQYHLPAFFAAIGLETEYEYTGTARLSTTDPDEFIRNADLVVDLIAQVDAATGNHLQNALDKIAALGTKILDWFPKT